MPGNYTLRKTYVDGDILAASDYVADNQQHIDNQDPQHTGDYSDNVTQMRTHTDTGDENTESLAATLAGEIERLRFVLKDIKAKLNGGVAVNQWYSKAYSNVPPNAVVTAAKLADGATFVQALNASASAVTPIGTNTTLVSQAITMARTHVRIHATCSGLLTQTGAGGKTLTWELLRDGSVISTTTSFVNVTPVQTVPIACAIPFIDTTTAAAHTYLFRMSVAGGGQTTQVDAKLMLEEIA